MAKKVGKSGLNDLRDCVLKNYATQGPQFCSDATGYNLNYVRLVASILGIRAPWHGGGGKTKAPLWTDKQIKRLKTSYGVVPVRQLAMELKRTTYAIHRKASAMGLGVRRGVRWDSEMDAVIVANYSQRGAAFCANLIGCTLTAVRKRAASLGIRRSGKSSEWFADAM